MQDQASNTVPMDDDGDPAGGGESELESVRRELAKWQERVPKLAAALKERTSEVEQLKAGQPAGETLSDAGIKARDELIAELESKVQDLTTQHRDLQGELHARDLAGKDLEADVAAWKEKWHSVTQSLDAQSQLAAVKKEELAQFRQTSEQALAEAKAGGEGSLVQLQTEYDDLKRRNASLNETTELANRQIESLGDNLNNLREQLRAKDAKISELSSSQQERQQDVSREIEALQTRASDFETRAQQAEQHEARFKAEFDGREAEVAEKTATCHRLEQENEQLTRDQDDLLAQLQTSKEAHESAIAQQTETFSKERDAEQERHMQAFKAKSVELQEAQAKALGVLEQRLASEHETRLAKSVERVSRLEVELAAKDDEWTERFAKIESEREERLQNADSLEQTLQERQAEIERLLGEQKHRANEIARLEGVVSHAEDAVNHREDERRQLSESLAEVEDRAEQLEAQLKERSEFAVTLEEEKQHLAAMLEGSKNEHKAVLEGKHKAERHAGEHNEHIAQLDDRLERQKELMEQLEVELVDVRDELETQARESRTGLAAKESELATLREELAVSIQQLEEQAAERERTASTTQPAGDGSGPDHSVELEALHVQLADYIAELNDSEVRVKELEALVGGEDAMALQRTAEQLEGTLRERTEELNHYRWREQMAQGSQEGDDPAMVLVVLNQQLGDARADNERLLKRIKSLESGVDQVDAEASADDLTQMKGIGPKLAEQLCELGYASFASIAELDIDELESKDHPLYPHRARVGRDEWIKQAAKLAS